MPLTLSSMQLTKDLTKHGYKNYASTEQLLLWFASNRSLTHRLSKVAETYNDDIDRYSQNSTAWEMSKYGVISGLYFTVFNLNTGKYGPEITPYLDTFHAVF